MKRHGSVIGLRPEKVEEYKKLHAAVWPEVVQMIKRSQIKNYSIFLRQLADGRHYLFSYLEYAGDDFTGDMAALAADPATKAWWAVCMPCQQPLPHRAANEWWAEMEEVFHCD